MSYHSTTSPGITVGILRLTGNCFCSFSGFATHIWFVWSIDSLSGYALLGTSNYLNVGPVSVISIFVYESLTPFEDPFTPEFVVAVVNLGLLIGLIQVLAGVFQLGRFVNYLPKSVVSGFVQAAAVVIIISQLSPGFGIPISLKSVM